ncbi:glycosyltransferase family 4 protein [Tenggerimyces flavus]|uniref:Glycosyltransferase family 4 protein n=1 Tax=Tenggerimyces flavus TaxID=1708749 RepID=A0ABV7YAH3_9ACTN|nr:glycosyltransferase family 4 protein [Tenggerimyces flavus]MBM7783826.1 glycosyltransferase involved in cell wall biosynthesis [Tenggerimyces flavus]
MTTSTLEALAVVAGVGKRLQVAPVSAADVMAAWAVVLQDEGSLTALEKQYPVIVRALRHARAAADAEKLARDVLPRLSGEVLALVRLELNAAQLAQGAAADDLAGAVRELLVFADEHLVAARFDEVAGMVVRINEAVFHRELHGEVGDSPLAYDTDAFLAPLRESLTYQALVAPSGTLADRIAPQASEPAPLAAAPVPAPKAPAQPSGVRALLPTDSARGRFVRKLFGKSVPDPAPEPVAEEPVVEARSAAKRVLCLSSGNLHFAKGLIADLRDRGAIETRVVQTREARYPRRGHAEMIADRLADAAGHKLPALPEKVATDLEWADIVFVDWFDIAAQWATVHVPAGKQLIIRVHSMEAVSPQPHLVDYTKVSDLIFVGAHVRDLFVAAVPAAKSAGRIHVIPNEMQLDRFGLPKSEAAERTIALVQWGKMVKDPIWALELLAELRSTDPSWRLLMAGNDFHESLLASAYVYRDAFRARLQEDDVRDAVVDAGYVTDLPTFMQDAGYILSSSRREGSPVSVIEGAASGAVPIVRDWPLYQPFNGARRLFPSEWVVSDVAEAAERIRSLDGDARAKAGEEARAHALETFDWPLIAPKYREIFLGS